MNTYAIGDVQGCFTTFLNLIDHISFNPQQDKLWLVGDLINRGPDSLKMLRWVKAHQDSIVTVLGNHDLHAIAVHEGFVAKHRFDTLDELLAAPDHNELFDGLRNQKLAHAEDHYLMVHAGVLPQWDTAQTLALAREVETALRAPNYREFLANMYGNLPNTWHDDLEGMDRLRVITNALTRLRICTSIGQMEFKFKGEVQDIPTGYMPWFEVENRRSQDNHIIFGHWSALGLVLRDNLSALDTGCLWGNTLTALRLADRQVFAVPRAPEDAIALQ
ncbi:MAG: symmetrical bis(5'-nucleosyl)-tetraphosphatase [Methylophilales bacterium]|nr:symmetrical bis(5'-nucleosyl)-tetraphosphatase [Methylophilales bacterium]